MLTVGHGTLEQRALMALLRSAGVGHLVDVRRFPASRRHPHVNRERLAEPLATAGIGYSWEEDLGGRRTGVADSPHIAIRDPGFRAYADHMTSEPFEAALERVLALDTATTVAVMCAESLWWRCHRRLIADAATLLHRADVHHLMHDGRLAPHRPTEGVRIANDRLVYDVGVDRPLDLR
ncbi:MAG: DUF488 domain-containing protein [Actinobacteria bacterium]|nr:DUF488 domain-containing protein [Actinomycetota bacterium]